MIKECIYWWYLIPWFVVWNLQLFTCAHHFIETCWDFYVAWWTNSFMYGLLTKCEVNMARYLPSSFLRVYGPRRSRVAKKERGQYPAILTEQAWSIKDLLYGFRGNFSCGTWRVVPSGQDSSILPARVANHSAGFDSSCPLTELAM